jgi:DNA-binding PadR family transcriptional regulator
MHGYGTQHGPWGGAEGGPGRHGRGRRRHHGRGFEGFERFGGPRGWGRKARRGDIRTAALLLLAEEPRNGYQIMQEVEQRSDGVWRPSPGSVYPALAQLEDEGLIRTEEVEGRRAFAITDAGREALSERGDRPAPWDQMSGDLGDDVHALARVMKEIAFAFSQVIRTGGEAQIARAREVLDGARRELYRILADGEGEGDGKGGPTV